MSEKKLMSCPFCGGEAFIYYSGSQFQFGEVICKECKSRSDRKIVDEAVESWNTRVPMQKIVERLEELQEEYKYPDDDDYIVGQYDGVREALTVVLEEGGLND